MYIETEVFFASNDPLLDAELVQLVDSYTKESVNYIQTTTGYDGLNVDPTESNLDGLIFRKRLSGKYYKRVFENEINILWFKAALNGVVGDFEALHVAHAFASKTNYKTLLFPETCDLDLNGHLQGFSEGITLKFDGGTIKNGTLSGANTVVQAPPYCIFPGTTLVNEWKSSIGFAYPEWFGTIPYDKNSVDLKDSVEKLKVFWNIKFNDGVYHSKKGEIPVWNFEGIAKGRTTIEICLDTITENVKYGLCLGKYDGLENEREYNNVLKNIGIITSSKVRKRNYSGVVMGAAHCGKIENIVINNSHTNMSMTKGDLLDVLTDIENRYKEANIGLEFRGCSELSMVNDLEVLSDIGVGFNTALYEKQTQGVDFPSIFNLGSACGSFGLANIFFGDTNVYNLTMDGIQSWNQGMYGLYACKSKKDVKKTNWRSFMHCSINNVRVEQLTEDIVNSEGKIMSTSIYIDEQKFIDNFIFTNIRVSGNSNGIFLGNAGYGYIEFNNISGVALAPVQYIIKTKHEADSGLVIKLKNMTAHIPYPMIHEGGMVIDNHYYGQSMSKYNICYHDVTVIRKDDVVLKNGLDGSKRFIQKDAKIYDSVWLKLYHSRVFDSGQNDDFWSFYEENVSYNINMSSGSYALKINLTLFKDGSYEVGPYDTSKIFVGDTTGTQNSKINIVYEAATGYWFINTLVPEKIYYDIEGLINYQ